MLLATVARYLMCWNGSHAFGASADCLAMFRVDIYPVSKGAWNRSRDCYVCHCLTEGCDD